jgi:hypothetical protein
MRLSGLQVLGIPSLHTPAPPSCIRSAFTLQRLEAAENARAKSATTSVLNFLRVLNFFRKVGREAFGVEYEMEHSS